MPAGPQTPNCFCALIIQINTLLFAPPPFALQKKKKERRALPQGYSEIFQVGSGKGLRVFLAEENMTTRRKERRRSCAWLCSQPELSGAEEPHTSVPVPRGEAGMGF